ncbi:hypothetical protein HED54_14130 [Ochrobactrum anthropi ATCC 49188]|uniref:Uncharacterized protein n=1 Tax=Brucella lupini TaxID=255457 RepID=A0A256GR13_9HYPH|nr:hypothetical protein [Brucella anthropi ATCC 49188]OYR29360.1 hypothetical protein CES86_2618 [Brucella lupini]
MAKEKRLNEIEPLRELISNQQPHALSIRAHPEKCETVFGKDARNNK